MLIIDLDFHPFLPKAEKAIIQKPREEELSTSSRLYEDEERGRSILSKSSESQDQDSPLTNREKLLRKLEEEDNYVRYQRALNHRKYFDLLGPDLLPLPEADFSEIYEEQRMHRDRLKSIYLKRMEVERTGTISQPKYMTDTELARLGAMKHDRANAYKNLNKLKKKVEESKIKGTPGREAELTQKIGDLEVKIMQYSHEIKKLVENGVVAR